MSSDTYSALATIFAALGDETRLSLVGRLSAGEALSIAELTVGTDITRQAVTKHLAVLNKAGLVDFVREGRERRVELRLRYLVLARRFLRHIEREWEAAVERLRALVED